MSFSRNIYVKKYQEIQASFVMNGMFFFVLLLHGILSDDASKGLNM